MANLMTGQYNALEFKAEFKAKLREGWQAMPLLVW
jgi:hypothetical protein